MSQGVFDFGGEDLQSEGKSYGPVPAGSVVRILMELEAPMYPAQHDATIGVAKSGLLQLPCKFTVVNGQYDGTYWFEQMALPASAQKIQLEDGQATACRINGAKLRAIIEASRNIDPKDNSVQACQRRRINRWQDFHGLQFPAKLGINNKPREAKNGKQYWDNTITRVFACTDKEYQMVREGGELITDGPVVGDPSKVKSRNGGGNAGGDVFGGGYATTQQDAFGNVPEYPEQRQTDEVPF